jgi:hypothetical protein
MWAGAAQAQPDWVNRYAFPEQDTVHVACGGKKKVQYRHAWVYTTLNGKWDGEKVPLCYDLTKLGKYWYVALEQGYENTPIFLADTAVGLAMGKDSVYRLVQDSWRINCSMRDYVAMMLVERYDPLMGKYVIDTVNVTDESNEYCFCGNVYSGRIRAVVVGAAPFNIGSGAALWARPVVQADGEVAVIRERQEVTLLHDTTYYLPYQLYNRNLVFSNHIMGKDSIETAYIDFEPEDSTGKQVRIVVNMNTGMYLQPYTELRGSVYDAATGARHLLSLQLDSQGTLCLYPIIELVINNNMELVYKGGRVFLHGQRACTMIQGNGRLIVDEQQHFVYGEKGEGILAMRPGAGLRLEAGASLEIGCMLLLADYFDLRQGGEIEVELHPGNELAFAPGAWVSNGFFEHGSVKLHVHLMGGVLDMHALDARSRELIRVTDHTVAEGLAEARIYPNPGAGSFRLIYQDGLGGMLHWRVYGDKGQEVAAGSQDVGSWNNEIQFDLGHLDNGVYSMYLDSPSGPLVKRVVVMRQ